MGNSLNPQQQTLQRPNGTFTSRQEMRPLSLKKEDVIKKAESIYHPAVKHLIARNLRPKQSPNTKTTHSLPRKQSPGSKPIFWFCRWCRPL
jgi:hypothetical protein